MFGVVRNVDQRGFVDQPRAEPAAARRAPSFLSGAEAAALLGIKRETLYAYTSRGLVRSEPTGRGRERRYRRDDLLRLQARRDARAGHGPVAAGALRWGEPVLESALTSLDAAGPRYRGQPAMALAASASFEAVAELLWSGSLPAEPPSWRTRGLGLRTRPLAALVPPGAHPLETLALAVPALGAADPGRSDLAPEAEKARARALIVRMAALAGFSSDPARARAAVGAGSVARAVLAGLGARTDAEAERAVSRALVLIADHELNASTFVVRVTASAKADLYACVGAGLAAASGRRHGGSCDRVEALVIEAARSRTGARDRVLERTRTGWALPGFGHPVYPGGDPRAPPLLRAAADLAQKNEALAALFAIIEAMHDLGGEPPSVDYGLVAIALALGLPPGSATALFVLGRAAGWVAHVLEQREAGFILRPRARYVGP
jgi:citrate synthase